MKREIRTGIFAGIGLLLFILDGKTGFYGAAEGLRMCMQTLIPSLFPFFLFSILLTNAISGTKLTILRSIGKLCHIPSGGESLFLTGILGGYPAGAQAVTQAYESGQLTRNSACRMLGFCSNAGPSFLFGIIASRFSDLKTAWILWGIHILSAIIAGILLPANERQQVDINKATPITVTQALTQSLKIMAQICGWVIIARVIIHFSRRWFLWIFPTWLQVAITGALELANGCCDLSTIPNEGIRLVLCSAMLSFGGICVLMQTISVTGNLGIGMYCKGKMIQTLFATVFAMIVQHILYTPADRVPLPSIMQGIICIILLSIVIFFCKKEKKSRNPVRVGV